MSPQQLAYIFWVAMKLRLDNGSSSINRLCGCCTAHLSSIHTQNLALIAWALGCLGANCKCACQLATELQKVCKEKGDDCRHVLANHCAFRVHGTINWNRNEIKFWNRITSHAAAEIEAAEKEHKSIDISCTAALLSKQHGAIAASLPTSAKILLAGGGEDADILETNS